MIEAIKYTPTEEDLRKVQMIRDFFAEEEIPYEEDENVFGLFYVNNRTTQIRYVDSFFHPMDNSKRFGETHKGIPHNYFIDISHENYNNGIRTIWVFDFEMDYTVPEFVYEGETFKDFHRQWEVIKNTIRTACGRIHYRFYARDCEVKEISNSEARGFLQHNCFYGYRSATKTLGLFLKKDKNGFKKGTLLFLYSYGANFYGNKNHQDKPKVEVIRASTKLECQVIGGISKCVKHFCENYPTLTVGGREVEVDDIIFYVDASHNDSRGMTNSNSSFKFVSWEGCGFINMFTEDFDDGQGLKGKKNEVFMRRPMYHKQIMKAIGDKKIISIANAGTIVFKMSRKEFVEGLKKGTATVGDIHV